LKLNLGGMLGETVARAGRGRMTLGIRPEDLAPAPGGDTLFPRGEVELVEDLGSDRFLHVVCDGAELIARAEKDAPVSRGDVIGLDASPASLHLFLKGARIEL
jgi:multiple sugar transport system ATP-binding protein